jgi:hypothetical protein
LKGASDFKDALMDETITEYTSIVGARILSRLLCSWGDPPVSCVRRGVSVISFDLLLKHFCFAR